MNWYDGLTDFQAWVQALDDNERIDSELNDVLGEELEEEFHRENLIIFD